MPAASNGKGDYGRLVYEAGDPATNSRLTAFNFPNEDKGKDEFFMPALAINWDVGAFEIISNTSYFDRDYYQFFEFTNFYSWYYAQQDPANGFLARTDGSKSTSKYMQTQENFTQEIRLQSTDDTARLKWVAGFFYSDLEQTGDQDIAANFLMNASPFAPFFMPFQAYDDGDPFGPGSKAFVNWFGVPMGPDSYIWSIDFGTTDKQIAGFAQIDFDITDDLTLTAGYRVSRTELDFFLQYGSPGNNLNAPQAGLNPNYDPSLGPVWASTVVDNKETATTPKIGLSYDINDDNMIYFNIAKGFRPAGASQQVPVTACGNDLINNGYVDENGNPSQPLIYDSDSVWSYEIGTKNQLFDNRLAIDASIYRIDWKDIQSSVSLPICAEYFTTNLGEAKSQGFDLAFQLFPIRSLEITGTVGYNSAKFTKDASSPGGVLIYSDGSVIPGSPPPWVYSLSAQQNFSLENGQPFYCRVDLTHRAEQRRVGRTDPTNPNYNPDYKPNEAYTVVNARIGTIWNNLDISLFVKNLTNTQPMLNAENTRVFTGYQRFSWDWETIRPRTLGVFVSYRY
jgi:outer membrane receptor protein involved in Fe transport